jgi:hypothetical protein
VGNIKDEFEEWNEDFEPELDPDLFEEEDVELDDDIFDDKDFEEEEE